jgi:tetratricopeptide (TPR) repeat protein
MKYLILALLSFSFAFFLAPKDHLSTKKTLALYQPEEKIKTLKEEAAFWQKKVITSPEQLTFKSQLAGAHSALFGSTANISDLKQAEFLLQEVLQTQAIPSANTLLSLAHNYISQHRFCEAMDLVSTAYATGAERRACELMLFDLYEELGDDAAQENLLKQLSEKKDFNYLIRLAKYEDGQGRLDRTIELMHQAEKIAESSQQIGLKIWVYTNLADYYGHFGNIVLSKSYFQKALALNPADWYSMKGLAYIAYSYDGNAEGALSILQRIDDDSADPGIKLLAAEINAYTGLQKESAALEQEVANEVSGPAFGHMYNAFLCENYVANNQLDKAMAIAEKEINLRATPASYDLKAQVLFAKGDIEGARQLSKTHIWNKTFEPHILKNQLIYFKDVADPYLAQITQELQEAKFELGPWVYQEII